MAWSICHGMPQLRSLAIATIAFVCTFSGACSGAPNGRMGVAVVSCAKQLTSGIDGSKDSFSKTPRGWRTRLRRVPKAVRWSRLDSCVGISGPVQADTASFLGVKVVCDAGRRQRGRCSGTEHMVWKWFSRNRFRHRRIRDIREAAPREHRP